MTAGTTGRDATLEEGREGLGASGIVPGHAYSILSVYTPKLTLQNNIKLVKLRNPWSVLGVMSFLKYFQLNRNACA